MGDDDAGSPESLELRSQHSRDARETRLRGKGRSGPGGRGEFPTVRAQLGEESMEGDPCAAPSRHRHGEHRLGWDAEGK